MLKVIGATEPTKDHIITLTDSEKEALYKEMSHIPYDPAGGCNYISELRFCALRTLPRRALEVLNKQKSSLKPRPFLVFENLPTDDSIYHIPHPLKYDSSAKSGSISENVLIAIASLIGEPYSIHFEGSELVNNLIPTKDTTKEFTGIGSEVELDFHTENAALKCIGYHNYSPQGLLLTGVHYDPMGPLTRVADARQALQHLTSKSIQTLRSPLFKIKVPYRWREFLGEENSSTGLVPIIRDNSDYPDIAAAFYPDMVHCTTNEAQDAFVDFHNAIKLVSLGLVIKPGMLVYIDNRFALHSRDSFKPQFDERGLSSRWIQRVFIAPNLWPFRDLKKIQNRVFQPQK